ncbi:MAG: PD-(D/E)XK nuclease family protein [Deltaproteobacteria bacterium]|nr:PD-(D/E)XK nuclease family protein [Deltaproteobacteria bacterium]MCW9048813.1 PD-(D/E)XK nuclease family protein [Deltaproteobacteria bacterium]
MQSIHHKTLMAAASGALILTANKRLSRSLQDLFDHWMQTQGETLWSTPQIHSFEGWLSQCLERLGDSKYVLNHHQEKCLWAQQIEETSHGTSLELLQISKTAEKAVQAHHLLNEYGLDLTSHLLTEDQRVFSLWQRHYRRHCEEQDWIDKSDLPRIICNAIKQAEIELPKQVLLIGFDQFPPGLKLLRQVASGVGCCCEEIAPGAADAGQLMLFAARDKRHEIESAARWARQLLDQGASSIGIIVPDLQRQRQQIERVFRDQIDPQAASLLQDEEALFSLSLGGPLAEQGVVNAALELLTLGTGLRLDQVSFLLRSPYLGGAVTEADARALFEQKLRSYGKQTFTLSALISQVKNSSGLPVLLKLLVKIQQITRLKAKASPGAWAVLFADHLQHIGWPGDRTIASREYQAVKAWREKVLEALAMLNQQLPSISGSQAVSLLRQLTKDVEFQLEGPSGPIQVIGLLESSGLSYQHLWVMGMSEALLPARPQPNPFIPYRLQEQYGMPHASAERELQFAEQVVARLKTAGANTVFSYPTRDGDCALRPSPLIDACGKVGVPPFAAFHDFLAREKECSTVLETLDDNFGPALQRERAQGGTHLLKDQAHCPFRAFVRHRLRCRALEEPDPGISALERGDLVHLALEKIWTELRTHAALLALDNTQREELIHTQVQSALADYFKERSSPPEVLLQLEQERVTSLIDDWLVKVESERDGFRVVETEQQHTAQIGPLQISLKVDRVDELDDGSRIVIDYKTGTDLRARDFLTAPLIEPQLPVYAVLDSDQEADGVAFAQVRKGSCRFIGLVRDSGLLAQVKTLDAFSQADQLGLSDWNALLVFWRQQLELLAADFVAGKAEVRPFDLNKSCRYCDLSGICRIQETEVIGELHDD